MKDFKDLHEFLILSYSDVRGNLEEFCEAKNFFSEVTIDMDLTDLFKSFDLIRKLASLEVSQQKKYITDLLPYNFLDFLIAAGQCISQHSTIARPNIITDFMDTLSSLCDVSAEIKHQLVTTFLDEFMTQFVRFEAAVVFKLDVLKNVNVMLESCSSSLRENLLSKSSTMELLCSTVKEMDTVGDYEIQIGVIEFLFRLIPRRIRESLIKKLFSQPYIAEAFMTIKDSEFETDGRVFLNLLNTTLNSTARVYSFPCRKVIVGNVELTKPSDPKYTDFWVDFNIGSSRITVFCEQTMQLTHSQTEELWETMSLWENDVDSLNTSGEGSEWQLYLQLVSSSCVTLPVICSQNDNSSVIIVFDRAQSASVYNALQLTYPTKVAVSSSKLSTVNTPMIQRRNVPIFTTIKHSPMPGVPKISMSAVPARTMRKVSTPQCEMRAGCKPALTNQTKSTLTSQIRPSTAEMTAPKTPIQNSVRRTKVKTPLHVNTVKSKRTPDTDVSAPSPSTTRDQSSAKASVGNREAIRTGNASLHQRQKPLSDIGNMMKSTDKLLENTDAATEMEIEDVNSQLKALTVATENSEKTSNVVNQKTDLKLKGMNQTSSTTILTSNVDVIETVSSKKNKDKNGDEPKQNEAGESCNSNDLDIEHHVESTQRKKETQKEQSGKLPKTTSGKEHLPKAQSVKLPELTQGMELKLQSVKPPKSMRGKKQTQNEQSKKLPEIMPGKDETQKEQPGKLPESIQGKKQKPKVQSVKAPEITQENKQNKNTQSVKPPEGETMPGKEETQKEQLGKLPESIQGKKQNPKVQSVKAPDITQENKQNQNTQSVKPPEGMQEKKQTQKRQSQKLTEKTSDNKEAHEVQSLTPPENTQQETVRISQRLKEKRSNSQDSVDETAVVKESQEFRKPYPVTSENKKRQETRTHSKTRKIDQVTTREKRGSPLENTHDKSKDILNADKKVDEIIETSSVDLKLVNTSKSKNNEQLTKSSEEEKTTRPESDANTSYLHVDDKKVQTTKTVVNHKENKKLDLHITADTTKIPAEKDTLNVTESEVIKDSLESRKEGKIKHKKSTESRTDRSHRSRHKKLKSETQIVDEHGSVDDGVRDSQMEFKSSQRVRSKSRSYKREKSSSRTSRHKKHEDKAKTKERHYRSVSKDKTSSLDRRSKSHDTDQHSLHKPRHQSVHENTNKTCIANKVASRKRKEQEISTRKKKLFNNHQTLLMDTQDDKGNDKRTLSNKDNGVIKSYSNKNTDETNEKSLEENRCLVSSNDNNTFVAPTSSEKKYKTPTWLQIRNSQIKSNNNKLHHTTSDKVTETLSLVAGDRNVLLHRTTDFQITTHYLNSDCSQSQNIEDTSKETAGSKRVMEIFKSRNKTRLMQVSNISKPSHTQTKSMAEKKDPFMFDDDRSSLASEKKQKQCKGDDNNDITSYSSEDNEAQGTVGNDGDASVLEDHVPEERKKKKTARSLSFSFQDFEDDSHQSDDTETNNSSYFQFKSSQKPTYNEADSNGNRSGGKISAQILKEPVSYNEDKRNATEENKNATVKGRGHTKSGKEQSSSNINKEKVRKSCRFSDEVIDMKSNSDDAEENTWKQKFCKSLKDDHLDVRKKSNHVTGKNKPVANQSKKSNRENSLAKSKLSSINGKHVDSSEDLQSDNEEEDNYSKLPTRKSNHREESDANNDEEEDQVKKFEQMYLDISSAKKPKHSLRPKKAVNYKENTSFADDATEADTAESKHASFQKTPNRKENNRNEVSLLAPKKKKSSPGLTRKSDTTENDSNSPRPLTSQNMLLFETLKKTNKLQSPMSAAFRPTSVCKRQPRKRQAVRPLKMPSPQLICPDYDDVEDTSLAYQTPVSKLEVSSNKKRVPGKVARPLDAEVVKSSEDEEVAESVPSFDFNISEDENESDPDDLIKQHRKNCEKSPAFAKLAKGQKSGFASAPTPKKATQKRKHSLVGTDGESADEEDGIKGCLSLTAKQLQPKKLFKAKNTDVSEALSLPVLANSKKKTPCIKKPRQKAISKSDLDDSVLTPDFELDPAAEDGSVTSFLSTFGTDIHSKMKKRQQDLIGLTRGVMDNTYEYMSGTFNGLLSNRQQMMVDFNNKMLVELVELQNEVEKLKKAEDDSMEFYKKQLSALQSSRKSQVLRLVRLKALVTQLGSDCQQIAEQESNKQQSVHTVLKKELTGLKHQLLRRTQEQEKLHVKNCLRHLFSF